MLGLTLLSSMIPFNARPPQKPAEKGASEASERGDDLETVFEELTSYFRVLNSDPNQHNMAYDHTGIYLFIEKEKENGALLQDPDWDWDYSREKKYQWKVKFDKAIGTFQKTLQRAAQLLDLTAMAREDRKLLQAIEPKGLKDVCKALGSKKSFHAGVAGPTRLEEEQEFNVYECQQVLPLGRLARHEMILQQRQFGNQAFGRGEYDEAERAYDRAIEAGSDDPALRLNRAAALLKLERFEETETLCTEALVLLDRNQSSTSNLRWKALVRRGMARKAIYDRSILEDPNDRERKRDLLLEACRNDFKDSLEIDPKDAKVLVELKDLEDKGEGSEPSGKTAGPSRTVLSSPFFRSDLISSLIEDTSRSEDFPRAELQCLLCDGRDTMSGEEEGEEQEKEKEKVYRGLKLSQAQREATLSHVQALSAFMALDENQDRQRLSNRGPSDKTKLGKPCAGFDLEKLVQQSEFGVRIGACLILMGEHLKAIAELEIVNANLRGGNKRRGPSASVRSEGDTERVEDGEPEKGLSERLDTLRLTTFRLLGFAYGATGKEAERKRFDKLARENASRRDVRA
ncbi:hypothetical protein IE53DRAFT_192756 [Violaceomyces palustris]|uniref:Uncharacterized protein n=1 Tax=Violaceomyces palustris TaxID=1673888 RepID=A0ACD0NRZ0_9BASI|nr:hypothetical protein IE53DRAFT_192756 [Violaceomyces palustris]